MLAVGGGMKTELIVIAALMAGFALAEALTSSFLRKPGQTRADVWVEVVGTALLIAVTQPLALAGGAFVANWVAPASENALQDWPVLGQLALLLIFDDLMQYTWHRLAHSVPWLYALHRPHHEAAYMSVRVVYRNNVFYYLLMPSLWLSGALIWLGLGWVYAFYVVVKLAVIMGAHCDVRWDGPLYRVPALAPLAWLVERTISTPATHFAHHGKHRSDGITHYKGNFGNLLFFWDVLFGTAKITRKYPTAYGVENLPATSAAEQLFWPLIRRRPT